MSSFRSVFKALCYNTLVKFFFFFIQGNADFFKFKNASELTRKSFFHKSFIQRANNASWLISHFDVAYCYALYGLSAFSNRHAVLRKF